MSDLRALSADELLAHLGTAAEDAARSLAETCGGNRRLEALGSGPFVPTGLPAEFSGRGVAVGLRVGDAVLLALVPEQIAARDADSSERWATLAQLWSMQLLPSTLTVDESGAEFVGDLLGACRDCRADENARAIVLQAVVDDEGTTSSHDGASIVVVWPVARMPQSAGGRSGADEAFAPVDPPGVEVADATAPPQEPVDPRRDAAAREAAARERVRRVMQLPVPVSVRLAEKRVELGTLLSMSPGTLIMFDKSCEDLLGLYVNNQLYALGEAVKIGEKFGLKVGEVGVHVVRSSPLVNS